MRILSLFLAIFVLFGCQSTNITQTVNLEEWRFEEAKKEINNYKEEAYKFSLEEKISLYNSAIEAIEDSALWFCNEYAVDKNKCSNFKYYYIQDESFNAFATENNGEYQIYLHTGVFNKINTIEETGFIVAHELAHHINNHIDASKRNAIVGETLGSLAGIILAGAIMKGNTTERDSIERGLDIGSSLGGSIGETYGAQYAFSSLQELEADFTAIIIFMNAFLDLNIAKKLAIKTAASSSISERFLQTHPSGPRRLASFNYNFENQRKLYNEIMSNSEIGCKDNPDPDWCYETLKDYNKAVNESDYFKIRQKLLKDEGFKPFIKLVN